MSEEFFDIVNERDEPVGRALRRDVHAQKLWHRAVHILVFNAAGEVFLQKRSMTKDMSPGLWDSSCAGHVDAGEEYDAAAIRELGEELGVQLIAPPTRWLRLDAQPDTGWEFCWVYRLRHEGPFVLHPEEIETGEWIAPAELARQIADQPKKFTVPLRLIWRLLPTL